VGPNVPIWTAELTRPYRSNTPPSARNVEMRSTKTKSTPINEIITRDPEDVEAMKEQVEAAAEEG